jgi:signal transduction histidine kinase
VSFYRADPLTIFGFLVQDARATAAQKKAIRQNRRNLVKYADLERALSILNKSEAHFNEDVKAAKEAIIESYKKENKFRKDLLELLKPEIQRNLAFLHDYKQFVSRVKQNINIVLETRYSDVGIEAKLEKALPAEAAIYWSSLLMTEKLQTAFLLLHPEKLSTAKRTIFRLHGIVLKYVRIYNADFKDKQVRLDVTGHSIGEVTADSPALGVIPHTLLDNALKYSQRGAVVNVSFEEDEEFIEFSVTSSGPKIDPDEKARIFEIFYRGRNAVREEEEGTGFGLYLAQFVAKDLGTEIKMRQSAQKTRWGYETVFSVRFPRTR